MISHEAKRLYPNDIPMIILIIPVSKWPRNQTFDMPEINKVRDPKSQKLPGLVNVYKKRWKITML